MKKKISVILMCILLAFHTMNVDVAWCMNPSVRAETKQVPFAPATSTVMGSVRSYMLSKDTNPDFSSIWNLFDLMRSGLDVPDQYKQTFYKNIINYLKTNNWQITRNRYTDYSKLILAVTALGKNAQNLEGHNLFYYLSDFTNVKKQGFNGPIWALIALKSHPTYVIPKNSQAKEQTTEEGLITYLLDREIDGGGWALSGNVADTDITGMTIQALASYYGKRNDVTDAIDRALNWLSENQLQSGGYATMGIETSESVAQVIVALSALGIDCAGDERFIKADKSPMNGLLQYYVSKGGFMHVLPGAQTNGGGSSGEIDGLATEQGMYATIAYERFLTGETALYDMSDITVSPKGIAEEDGSSSSTEKPSQTTQEGSSDKGSSLTVKVSRVSLDYSQIGLKKGKTRTLKASVYPSNASNKSLTWKSSDPKIATVSSKGLVKGIKAGTVRVTATAKDGSKKKATCTVVVTTSSTSSTQGSTSNSNQSKTAGGTTKTLTSSKSSKTTSSTQSKQAGNGQNGDGNTTSENQTASEATTQAGWSFTGDDYIPENYDVVNEEETTEENIVDLEDDTKENKSGSWSDQTITLTIPIGAITYVLLGMVILGAAEAIIWVILRRRKNHENK